MHNLLIMFPSEHCWTPLPLLTSCHTSSRESQHFFLTLHSNQPFYNIKLKFPNAFPSTLSHNIGVPKVSYHFIVYLNGVVIKVDETTMVEPYHAISLFILFFSSHVSKNSCLGVNNISMRIYGLHKKSPMLQNTWRISKNKQAYILTLQINTKSFGEGMPMF